MVGWLEFNIPFQHKYGNIRDEQAIIPVTPSYSHLARPPSSLVLHHNFPNFSELGICSKYTALQTPLPQRCTVQQLLISCKPRRQRTSDLVECKVIVEMLLVAVAHLAPQTPDSGTHFTDGHARVCRLYFLPNLQHVNINTIQHS